jgi:hypothetical protein
METKIPKLPFGHPSTLPQGPFPCKGFKQATAFDVSLTGIKLVCELSPAQVEHFTRLKK